MIRSVNCPLSNRSHELCNSHKTMFVGTTSRGSRGRNVILRRLSSAERRRKAYNILAVLTVVAQIQIKFWFFWLWHLHSQSLMCFWTIVDVWVWVVIITSQRYKMLQTIGCRHLVSSSTEVTKTSLPRHHQRRHWNNYHRVLKKFSLRVSKIWMPRL